MTRNPTLQALPVVWWQEVTRCGTRSSEESWQGISKVTTGLQKGLAALHHQWFFLLTVRSGWFTQQLLVLAKVFSHTMVVIINSFQKQNSTWYGKMSCLCVSLIQTVCWSTSLTEIPSVEITRQGGKPRVSHREGQYFQAIHECRQKWKRKKSCF